MPGSGQVNPFMLGYLHKSVRQKTLQLNPHTSSSIFFDLEIGVELFEIANDFGLIIKLYLPLRKSRQDKPASSGLHDS